MENTLSTIFIGIDVSYEKLDIAYQIEGQWLAKVCANDWASVEAFASSLVLELPAGHCVVEHTGTYSSKIIFALCERQFKVSVISPNQSRAFARLKHRTTKNDRADARLLAEFGLFNASDLRLYTLPQSEHLQFRQLLGTIEQVEKMLGQVRNQRHAHEQLPPPQQQSLILETHRASEAHLQSQIETLYAKIKELDRHNDPDLDQSRELMTSVKGIGEKTANTILAKLGSLKKFSSAKQIAKFAGIAPTEKLSGSSVRGSRSINRSGNASLRKALYCATWSAVRCNNACKALFLRLRAKGKPAKVALIAVANLLIRQIFAVVTSQKLFDNNFCSKKCIMELPQ